MMVKNLKYYLPLLGLIIVVGFFWRGLGLHPQALPSVLIDQPAANFVLPNLLAPEQLIDQQVFQGSWTLLNVWASWCQTCTQEQAFLLSLKQRYPHLHIIGLDFQDNPIKAVAWLKKFKDPYQLVLSDPSGKVGVDYGVYGTPESFLIDSKGIIRAKITGVLNEQSWPKMAILLT